MSGLPPAVVLQASGPNALAIIRSLGRTGVPVIACDHDPAAIGLVSRYSTAAITANPLTEPERFADDLLALGRGAGRGGVLYATHDEAVAALGPRQAEVDELFRRPWTPWPEVNAIMDKEHQHRVARETGFPVPATVDPRGRRRPRGRDPRAALPARAQASQRPRVPPPLPRPPAAGRRPGGAAADVGGDRALPPPGLRGHPRRRLAPVDLRQLPRRLGPGARAASPAASCASGRSASARRARPRPTGTPTSPTAATPCSTRSATTGSRRWRSSATRATGATTSSRSTPAPGSGSAWRRPAASTCRSPAGWTRSGARAPGPTATSTAGAGCR